MNKSLKLKLGMFVFMSIVMIFYILVFGQTNAIIGLMVVIAAFLNLGNDLSSNPKLSFIKIFSLLMILGIASYLNSPITILSCILTFFIVFATTFSSYELFGTHCYLPFLMVYFMMSFSPVTFEDLAIRMLSLALGAVIIVGLNLIINRNKYHRLSENTISLLIEELIKAADLKLNGDELSSNSFKVVNGFYSSIISKFKYNYFPTQKHESVVNVIKAFQNIGWIMTNFKLSEDELKYIKHVLADFKQFRNLDGDVLVETKGMNLILLNFKIIENEIDKKTLKKENDSKKALFGVVKPLIKRQLSFKSAKFTFAFKMAFVLTLWEVLTLIFNFPYTKWLFFASISLMVPYIDDIARTARNRIGGTLIGVFCFALIMIAMPYIPIPNYLLIAAVLFLGIVGIIFSFKNRLVLLSFTTLLSVTVSLMYITPPEAIELKILWVAVAVIVVSFINYGFLPYSVEKQTKNNLKTSYILNKKFLDLIKSKCMGEASINKTALLVVSNIIHENIEITDKNKELYRIQSEIRGISNFILAYMDIYDLSPQIKRKMIKIIEEEDSFNNDFDDGESAVLFSLNYVVQQFNKEKELIKQ